MKKHNIGRLTSALSAAAMAVTAFGYLPPTPVSAASLSGKDAKGIVSEMKIGWNLGNTLDSTDSGLSTTASPAKFAKAWGNPEPTADQFQAVKDAGFNTVRIPTTWYQHIEWDEDSQMYLVNDQWMDYVKKTVDYAIDRDMFVILNVHHEDWVNVDVFTDETYQDAKAKLTSIWSQVAETFQDYDQHLIFEGMNEPRQLKNPKVQQWGNGSGDDGYTWQYINNLNAAFVKTVRGQGSAANKERLLMLPGYCASNDKTAISNIAIPDGAGNVALSVHAYTPYYFTMATDEKANHTFPGASGWGADYEAELSNMFDYLGQLQDEKNAPIIIGEFSASDFSNTEDRCRWATDYLTKAKAKGIPCVLWDNNVVDRTDGEAHGYLYRDTCTWYTQSKPVVQAMMDVYGIKSNMKDYEKATEPVFDWSNLTIGSDWKEIFKSTEGEAIKVWGNTEVSGWQDYLDGNYDFVMFYDSKAAPELVLQGEGKIWDRVDSSDETDTPFTKTFTYEDLKAAVEKEGHTFEDMTAMFISATSKAMTAYGLYAVPKSDVTDPTEPTTEPDVQPTTEATEPSTNPTSAALYTVSVNVYDQNGEPVSGVKVSLAGETWATTGKPLTLTTDNPKDVVKIVSVPDGYVMSTEDGDSEYVLSGQANEVVAFRVLKKAAGEEQTFAYADLEDGEEGKLIPISDPEHLSKIIINVTSDSSENAAWYCGGGAVCSAELTDGTDTFWGYKEFQWNKGDTEVTITFDGNYMKSGETEDDPAVKTEAVLTGDTLELRHWWAASAEDEKGSDVTFEYGDITVIYDNGGIAEPTIPTTETLPVSAAKKYGDVNGDEAIDIMDVIALNKYLLGSTQLDADAQANADVDNNGVLESTDSLNILKYVVELLTAFPVK